MVFLIFIEYFSNDDIPGKFISTKRKTALRLYIFRTFEYYFVTTNARLPKKFE